MTQRARFGFQAPPKNRVQLEHLIVVDRNIAYADATRQSPSTMEGAKVAGRGVVAAIDHHVGTSSSPNKVSTPGKTCLLLLWQGWPHSEKLLCISGPPW
jgi:hypothetical protein